MSTDTSDQKFLENGHAAFDLLHKGARAPGPWPWFRGLLIAALPILLFALMALVLRAPEIPESAINGPEMPGLAAATSVSQSRLSETQEDAAVRYETMTAQELQGELGALIAAATTQTTERFGDTVTAFERFSGGIALVLAMLVLGLLTIVMIPAQRSFILRFTGDFWVRGRSATREGRPILFIWLWALFGFGLLSWGAIAIGRRVPWMENAASQLPNWWDLMAAPVEPVLSYAVTPLAALSVLFGLVFALTSLTAWGAYVAARSFPAQKDAFKAQSDLIKLRGNWPPKDRLQESEVSAIATSASTLQTADPVFIKEIWAERNPKPQDVAVINNDLTAVQIIDILKTLARPLVVVFVLALVVVYLGMKLLEANLDYPSEIMAQIAASHNMLLVATGVFLTLSYGAIFVPAFARLDPYMEAEKYLASKGSSGSKPKQWILSDGTGADAGSVVIAEKEEEEQPTQSLDATLRAYLGVSTSKFRTILVRGDFSGGMQSLLERGAMDQIKLLATVLAPTFSGSILALLG